MKFWYQSYNYDKNKRKLQPSIILYGYYSKVYDEYIFFDEGQRITLRKTEQGIIVLIVEMTKINNYSYDIVFVGNEMCVEPNIVPKGKTFLISDENIKKYKTLFDEICNKISYYKKIYEMFNNINKDNEVLAWGL